jgi:ribonuclease J
MTTLTTPKPQPQPLFHSCEEDDRTTLRLIPLGGLGEFGLNMMCYETGGERIVVDCGSMFPDTDMLGIDLVVPDIQYLLDEPERLKAIVLTHAHEDHIGALPYILSQIPVPVYGTRLTLAYVEEKLREHEILDQTDLCELTFREPVHLGHLFTVTALHVTHSVPDSAALAIATPAGVVVHSGDYKIDYSPVDNNRFDHFSFSKLGEAGVLALVGDSTNANVPGTTHTERWVSQHLESIFASSEGTIFCTTFSTSIHRLQILMNLAERFGRRIFVVGRSLEKTFRIGAEHGLLDIPQSFFCSLREYDYIARTNASCWPRDRRVNRRRPWPCSRATNTNASRSRKATTVILSARTIPNNVRSINRMVNHLCRRGARVFDASSADVHASGHAYREEIKALISLTQPQFLIPAHGELRQLLAHRDAAIAAGFDERNIFILDDGDVIEFRVSDSNARARATADLAGHVPSGHVLVDGKTVGETGDVVLRDRRHLSEDGMVIAILNVDKKSGELLNDPEIVTRGFVCVDESEELINRLRAIVREAFEACTPETREDPEVLHPEIRRALRRYIRRNYERFPLILPVVQEV